MISLLGWGFSYQAITSSARRPAPDHFAAEYAAKNAASTCLYYTRAKTRQMLKTC
jgi:hypothetical protein